MTPNPFTPGFGQSPPELAGRDVALEEVAESFTSRPVPAAHLVSGLRGMGKTSFLNACEDVALEAGWRFVSESARPGVVGELVRTQLPTLLRELDPRPVDRRITGGGIPGAASISSSVTERHPVTPSLRSQLEQVCDLLAERRSGLLLTIDEIHPKALPDLVEICQAFQHLVRSRRAAVLVVAGLPGAVAGVLAEPQTTFLRRAARIDLGPLTPTESRSAFLVPVNEASRTIEPAALESAVEASRGYPYLTQFIGREMWKAAEGRAKITSTDVEIALPRVLPELGRQVHESALAELTRSQRNYLHAMSEDDGPSRAGDLQRRLGVGAGAVGNLRRDLIDTGVVESTDYGMVDFTLPYMREYLRGALGD